MRKLALILALVAPEMATAQMRHEPMGSRPWDFNERTPHVSAALQERRRAGDACGCGLGGIGIASTTSAIGNWTQINMTLGDGANGMINAEEHQNNWGSHTATSSINGQTSLPGLATGSGTSVPSQPGNAPAASDAGSVATGSGDGR